MFICPHPICGAPLAPKKRLYFNDLVNTILNEEKGCRRRGATSWLPMLVKCTAPGTAVGREGGAEEDNVGGHLRHTHPCCDIPSMRHLHVCSHTKSFLFA